MDTLTPNLSVEDTLPRQHTYDPKHLHPLDARDRTDDDASTDLEIIASTQDDELEGRYSFSSEHHPTHEAGMAALRSWLHAITEEVLDEIARTSETDAPRA